MPVRLTDTAGLQGNEHHAGLLTFEDRKVVLMGLAQQTAIESGGAIAPEMEQMRLIGDQLRGYPRVTKP